MLKHLRQTSWCAKLVIDVSDYHLHLECTLACRLCPIPYTVFQTQRWGTVDKKKKRPRQASLEEASLEGGVGPGLGAGDEHTNGTEANGDVETEVRCLDWYLDCR